MRISGLFMSERRASQGGSSQGKVLIHHAQSSQEPRSQRILKSRAPAPPACLYVDARRNVPTRPSVWSAQHFQRRLARPHSNLYT